jgi:hypothetical protein
MTELKPILGAESKLEIVEVDKKLFLPGEIGVSFWWELKDKDGNVVQRGKEKKSDSFLKQFMQFFHVSAANLQFSPIYVGLSVANIRDTSNTLRLCYNSDYGLPSAAGASANANYGILVGTDDTAVAIDQYNLIAKVAHGTGAGQLQYAAMAFAAPTATVSIAAFVCSRDFSNGSGGSIVLKEAGLALNRSSQYFLILRDLIEYPTGLTVTNGLTFALHYKIQTTI